MWESAVNGDSDRIRVRLPAAPTPAGPWSTVSAHEEESTPKSAAGSNAWGWPTGESEKELPLPVACDGKWAGAIAQHLRITPTTTPESGPDRARRRAAAWLHWPADGSASRVAIELQGHVVPRRRARLSPLSAVFRFDARNRHRESARRSSSRRAREYRFHACRPDRRMAMVSLTRRPDRRAGRDVAPSSGSSTARLPVRAGTISTERLRSHARLM